jgi:hypothetical protein
MKCFLCNSGGIYSCIICKSFLCNKCKEKHEKAEQHSFDILVMTLPSQITDKIAENLSTKIRITKECSTEIIAQTEALISQIKLQTLTKMYTKKQEYLKLLALLQYNNLRSEQTTQLQQEKTSCITTFQFLFFPKPSTTLNY